MPKINVVPEIEAFFVALMLQHGTNPKPVYGFERETLISELTVAIHNHPGKPLPMESVQKNYRELGGKSLPDAAGVWFYNKMAHAYLDWLYSQPQSQALIGDSFKDYLISDADPARVFKRRWE